MKRSTIPTVLVAAMVLVAMGTVGAVAAPLASGDAAAAAMQEGDGNTTVTPTPTPVATDSTNETNATAETTETSETNATNESPTFGAVVSSFMQTNAADAENEVEDGLFEAKFDRSNASERARLVRQRATQLGDRIAELRAERAALLDRENVTVRERAQAARLSAQSNGLAKSISQTENAAQRADVALNQTALEELRTEARNLTGPEVADLARGLVDKEKPPRGPPSDRGPNRDGADAENATDTNETDVSDDAKPGRSGDAGRPTETDTESGDDSQSTQSDTRANSSDSKPGANERDPQSGGSDDGDSTTADDTSQSSSDSGTGTATPTEDGGDGTKTESAQ